jgi:hypothetical protein
MSTNVALVIVAVVGVAGTLGAPAVTERLRRRRATEAERRAALVGLWAAANSMGMLYATVGGTLPKRSNWFTQVRYGIQMSSHANLIIERLLNAADRMWIATGRLRVVARAQELDALNEIEGVFSEWAIGEPLPDAWSPAIQRLRRLLEARGVPL